MSLTPLSVTDPILARRRAQEERYLREVAARSPRLALVPWTATLSNVGGRLELGPTVALHA